MNIDWKLFAVLGLLLGSWDLGREVERAVLVIDIGDKLERIAKSNEEIALKGESDPDPTPVAEVDGIETNGE